MELRVAGRLMLIASAAALAGGVAFGQSGPTGQPKPPPFPGAAAGEQQPAGAQDDATAAQRAAGRRGNSAQATREFLGLGAAPDAVAVGRGGPIYAQNCAACHGPDARGGIGPNLLYSNLVLDDDHGEKIAPFLAVGRPEKGMPPFPTLADRERRDIAEFLHQQVENYANRGTYKNTNDVMTGNAVSGAAFFRANCVACHAASGDMKGVAARYRPLDLQRNAIFPARENHPTRAVRATVTTPAGAVEGRVTKIDDFTITLVDASGAERAFRREPGVTVTLKDPLQWHKDFSWRVKDAEMTDLVTYLGTLK